MMSLLLVAITYPIKSENIVKLDYREQWAAAKPKRQQSTKSSALSLQKPEDNNWNTDETTKLT